MNRELTLVEIAFYPEYLNNWLRFGVPDLDYDLDRRRALACFEPGRIFGYVRWVADEYGTQKWHFYVVRTADASQLLTRIDGVHPGGEILLETAGNVKVKQVLSLIDGLENSDFDPGEISTAYYRHIHNRVAVRQPIHPYSNAQHAAAQAAQMVLS